MQLRFKNFYNLITALSPWLGLFAVIFLCYGTIAGLFFAPMDYQQKDAFRIIYVHVPCALLSLTIYAVIACMSIIYLIWRIKISDIIAKVSAPIGAVFTFLALITGSIWGKPMWGTWWVWDARLTSELILLFLYFGYIGLRSAIVDVQLAGVTAAVLAIIGIVDIPIIHFSVQWWETLHQGATISKFAKPKIATDMLYPLLSMIISFYLFYALLVCLFAQSEILLRESKSKWVQKLFECT